MDERRSHLRASDKVLYFTYDDLYIIPDLIEKIGDQLTKEEKRKMNLIQKKIKSNFVRYERARERARINKRKRMKRLKSQQKEVNVNDCR